MKSKPPPGSDAAALMGCKCPRMDNGYGRGWLGDGAKFGYVVNMECSVHNEDDAKGEMKWGEGETEDA